jgi:hypothetical protein
MKKKMVVKARTISFSYVTLHNAAHYALQAAQGSEDGGFFNCLYAMIFAAFSLEAYLNHLGNSEFPDWPKFERRRSPRQKLDVLVEKRGYAPDFTKPPFSTFDKIFAFRKQIAHGRTEHIEIEQVQDGELGDAPDLPTTSWETVTSLENAVSFVEDAASMIRALHPIFGYPSDALSTEWKSSWEAKPYADGS